MARLIEMDKQRDIRSSSEAKSMRNSTAHYLGVTSDDQERVTLIEIDPADPWEAFRAARKRLRKADHHIDLALYDAPQPVEKTADIVVLRPRQAV